MITRALVISVALAVVSGSVLAAAELYVSPDGSDENPGTRERPFATLERARDAARALAEAERGDGGLVIWLAGGAHYRDGTFELTQQDSGTQAAPVIYRGAPGQEARVIGGRPVTRFEPVTNAAELARLHPDARAHVLRTDLHAQGFDDLGQIDRRGFVWPKRDSPAELFFRGEPMQIARYPNDGFLRITSVPDGADGGRFGYDDERPASWPAETDLWVFGYWTQDWADSYEKVARLDTDAMLVETVPPHGVYGYRESQRFYFHNVLAELDAPGEYYIDRDAGILYFWPPQPVGETDAVLSTVGDLVRMRDCSQVLFRDITFEACRGTALRLEGCTDAAVVACTVRNTGRQGVYIAGGSGCGVVGCDIYDTGEGAVALSGGDRRSLTPSGHLAENNHLHHFGRICRTYSAGVHVSGVGQRVAHNLIENAPHVGILFGGNDHLIELNELHSLCYETGDVGAMYTGRDWTARGTLIRHNFLHHVRAPGRYSANGIYLDDAASGTTVFGNVFFQVTKAAYIGGGRDNTYENNVFVDCVPALHVDARAMGWMSHHVEPDGVMQERLRNMPYRQPPWSERYPRLVNILEDEPAAPKGNLIARNVRWGGTWAEIEEEARPYLTFVDNLQNVDPLFVDAASMDFRLRPDSPVWEIGFRPIPFERIGLYPADTRASWPATHSIHPYSAVPEPIPEPPATPKPEPARTGPPAVFAVPRTNEPPRIDGVRSPDEWAGQEMAIQQRPDGDPAEPASGAWICWNEEALYVLFQNEVDSSQPIRPGNEWGADDAVEVALRDAADAQAPILVLRGFPSGSFHATDESGTPADLVARLGRSARYAARVEGEDRWTAEWRIPFEALGIEPAVGRRIEANLTVRKTAVPLWLMWQGTGRWSWEVGRAGLLELQ